MMDLNKAKSVPMYVHYNTTQVQDFNIKFWPMLIAGMI